ncbi:MAG: hypothetical protein ABSA02_16460 [Trebonia sp.]
MLRDQVRNRNQGLFDLARAFADGTQAIAGTRQLRPAPNARAM